MPTNRRQLKHYGLGSTANSLAESSGISVSKVDASDKLSELVYLGTISAEQGIFYIFIVFLIKIFNSFDGTVLQFPVSLISIDLVLNFNNEFCILFNPNMSIQCN